MKTYYSYFSNHKLLSDKKIYKKIKDIGKQYYQDGAEQDGNLSEKIKIMNEKFTYENIKKQHKEVAKKVGDILGTHTSETQTAREEIEDKATLKFASEKFGEMMNSERFQNKYRYIFRSYNAEQLSAAYLQYRAEKNSDSQGTSIENLEQFLKVHSESVENNDLDRVQERNVLQRSILPQLDGKKLYKIIDTPEALQEVAQQLSAFTQKTMDNIEAKRSEIMNNIVEGNTEAKNQKDYNQLQSFLPFFYRDTYIIPKLLQDAQNIPIKTLLESDTYQEKFLPGIERKTASEKRRGGVNHPFQKLKDYRDRIMNADKTQSA